ncbi:MAG: AIR synthase-related protein [Bacteroidales bacterium]
MDSKIKYEQRGVSASKGDVKNAIKKLDKGLFPKSFCKVIPDVLNEGRRNLFGPRYCNIMHADGAGTKAALAYLYWRETGDISVWKGIAQDAIVMNTDDLICVGGVDNMVLTSTIGRNKFRIPGEVISEIINGTQEFIDELAKEKIHITFAGGETADIGDLVKTIVVDSTVSTRLRHNDVISNDRIQAGDVIIGLSSSGQASYEKYYNSGIASNGLTSARHDVLSKIYAEKYPETFDDQINLDLVYSGSKLLTDPSEVKGLNIGQLLLSPTRTYAPVLKAILESFRPSIHGLIHCSGGGQTKVMNFVENMHVIKNNLFEVPPVFKLIQGESKTPWSEMYQVYNMGHRMEIFTKEKLAEDIIKIAQYYGIDAQIIGHTEAAAENKLSIESTYGVFHY